MTTLQETFRLEGVEVDDLTRSCLDIAATPEESDRLYGKLRSFFHDSRNRLNQLKLGLYVARRSGDAPTESQWDHLERSYGSLEQLIERLQMILRPTSLDAVDADLTTLLNERRASWTDWLARTRSCFDRPSSLKPITGRFDPIRMAQGLDALASWRHEQLAEFSTVRLRWGCQDESLFVVWEEMGSVVSVPLEGGTGQDVTLALPLLTRIIAAHGGHVEVAERNGLRVELRWPREAVEQA